MTRIRKVGLIVDDLVSTKQLHDLIVLSQSSYCYEISHLIVQKNIRYRGNIISRNFQRITQFGLMVFLRAFFFKMLCKLESLAITGTREFDALFGSYDLSQFGLDIVYVEPKISSNGLVCRYSQSDLDRLGLLNLSLLIRGGENILRGEILELCEYGVISFHHADNDLIRGGLRGSGRF